MAAITDIAFAHMTYSPWRGCTRVSAGCVGCYAELDWGRRFGQGWGPKAPRTRKAASTRNEPTAWERRAVREGTRFRVFPSLCDPFDDHPSIEPVWRADFWDLIARTPHIDWLLFTKRPENWPLFLPSAEGHAWPHVRLISTIEDSAALAERGPIVGLAASLGWRVGVSFEPALGPVDWTPLIEDVSAGWLVMGGMSDQPGHPANETPIEILRDTLEQLRGTAIRPFVKQLGSRPTLDGHPFSIAHKDGADLAEWPVDLRVRELPDD